MLSNTLDTDILGNALKSYQGDENKIKLVLHTAVCSFLTFCDIIWSAHPKELELNEYLGIVWPQDADVSLKLQRDSEPLYTNILYPELLYFSSQVFSALCSVEQNLVSCTSCFLHSTFKAVLDCIRLDVISVLLWGRYCHIYAWFICEGCISSENITHCTYALLLYDWKTNNKEHFYKSLLSDNIRERIFNIISDNINYVHLLFYP